MRFTTSRLLVAAAACKLDGCFALSELTVPMRKEPKRHPRRKRKALPRATVSRKSVKIPLTRRDKLAGQWFAKLVALQAQLRGPGGCPWDHEQTHDSLRKFLIEETYEVLDAMDSGDPRKFYSELGDLLLQVIFHSIVAEEVGRFTISDVIESIHEKMVRRHPHVFGTAKAKDSAAVLKNWEQIKAEERAAEGEGVPSANAAAVADSILGGVPRSLPAVLEAYQLTRRASRIGFDWDSIEGIFDKLDEERRELAEIVPASSVVKSRSSSPNARVEEETGDLLFVGVNIARYLGVDPEIALKKANLKFKNRFQWMESAATGEGKRLADLPRPRMEELWNASKAKG